MLASLREYIEAVSAARSLRAHGAYVEFPRAFMRHVNRHEESDGYLSAPEALARTGTLEAQLPRHRVRSDASDSAGSYAEGGNAPRSTGSPAGFKPDKTRAQTVVLIERSEFLRECVARGLSAVFPGGVESYGSPEEFLADESLETGQLIVFSTAALAQAAVVEAVGLLAQGAAGSPVLVLSYRNDLEFASALFERGAKGFIPGNMDYQLVLETARFVAAGGSYLPTELLGDRKGQQSAPTPSARGVTSRELDVVRAIRQGKPNKIIAHELNMCESTVKVHIRHVMKKLQARNRTDLAIKSAQVLDDR